jgi:proline iminopeptidase
MNQRLSVGLFTLAITCTAAAHPQDRGVGESRAAESSPHVYQLKEGFVDAAGLMLYYVEIGAGRPLVVLHGGPGGSHNYFLPYLLPLARTNRLILIDERGSGRSGKSQDPSKYTVENMADDVETVRAALKLGRINLLGHSFGGVVAQAYAFRYPKSLSHLILANTFYSTRELNHALAEAKAKIDPSHLKRIEELEKAGLFGKGEPWEHGRYPAEYIQLVNGWFYYPAFFEQQTNPNFNPSAFNVTWDVYLEMSGSNGEFVVDGNMTSVEYADKLKTLNVPTLVIAGADDPLTLEILGEMHTNIVGSQLAVVPGSKHFTFIDQPDRFNQIVDRFIH